MKSFKFLILFLFVSAVAMAATIKEDELKIGKPGSSADKIIRMGDSIQIRANETTGSLEKSEDGGANFQDIGAGGAGGAGGVNLLRDSNFDFELGDPPNDWTESGGVFQAETTNPGFEDQSGSWDASAASENLDSVFVSVPSGLEGRKCNATIQYKYAAGASGDYKLQAVANSAGLLAELDLDVATEWRKAAVQFTCPTSDSVKVRLTSTVDGSELLIDNALIGRSDFVDISQATIFGQAKNDTNASCVWSTTSASFADFAADADCTWTNSGKITGTAQLPEITFSNAPAGTYEIKADIDIQISSETTGTTCQARIFDGSSEGDVGQRFAVVKDSSVSNNGGNDDNTIRAVYSLSSSGSPTFKIQGQRLTGDGNCDLSNGAKWTVVRYPLSAAEAITLETTGFFIDADISGASPSLGTTVDGGFSQIEDGSLSISVNGGSANAFIPCVSGEAASGSTCTGNEAIGLAFNVTEAGAYQVCTGGSIRQNVNPSGDIEQLIKLVRTSNTDPTSILDDREPTDIRFDSADPASGNNGHNGHYSLCETFALNTGLNTFRSLEQTTIATNVNVNTLSASTIYQKFTVTKLNEGKPTPAFTDLTDSLNNKIEGVSSNVENIFSAIIASNGTITSQIGSWIDTSTKTATGRYTITVLPAFQTSNDLICQCTTRVSNTSDETCKHINVDSAQADLRLVQGSSDTDLAFNLTCHN